MPRQAGLDARPPRLSLAMAGRPLETYITLLSEDQIGDGVMLPHRKRMGEVILSGACADVSGNEIWKYLLQFLVETQEFLCLMFSCLFNDD